LRSWLDEHKINVPKAALQDQLTELVESNWYAGQTWTEKQVEAAKGRYDNLKDYAFDTSVSLSFSFSLSCLVLSLLYHYGEWEELTEE